MGMYGRVVSKSDADRHAGTDVFTPLPGTEGAMTKQSFADETDINKIIARFAKTGMLDSLNDKEPFYGDVSDILDYQASLNLIREADELFMAMSPEIRERFKNDPQLMIDFLENPGNLDEAIKLGMVVPRPVVAEEPVVALEAPKSFKRGKVAPPPSKEASELDLDI